MSTKSKILLVILTLVILGGVAFAVPPIQERVMNRISGLVTRIRYTLYPPEKVVFVPQSAIATAVQQTLTSYTPTPVPSPTVVFTPTLPPQVDTPTPVPTPTALPANVALKGVKYVNQHGAWNYCAPANLAMELNYWGWTGTREDIGKVVKPFPEDYNVMPYELADYVTNQTNLKVVQRSGGTLTELKNLLANDFVVLIEGGVYFPEATTGRVSWMGHYAVITGYDDARQEFITQDSYILPTGIDHRVKYDDLETEWRAFNNVFLVTYPPEKEQKLMAALGDYADDTAAERIAAKTASDEIIKLSGNDQFFAWFNRGTSLVHLQDYAGAADAYDEAFKMYPSLEETKRPWRMMWYQTGPYFAYYFNGRYQDVITLASQTIDFAANPYLEESFYWRGRAKAAIGDVEGDIADQRLAIKYHPGFAPSLEELNRLGVSG